MGTMTATKIRTRYATATNGGGRIVARGAGRTATIHYPHEWTAYFRHQAAAEALAGKLGLVVGAGEATDDGYEWQTEPIPATWRDAEKWDAGKARELSVIARQLFTRHDHNMSDRDPLTRENCGACALNGYGATADGPNYAGWARAYVQARRPVPEKWVGAFLRQLLRDDNEPYRVALMRDLATFGVPSGLPLA